MELIVEGQTLVEMKIQRGIFQGDAFSLLLFLIAVMQLNQILRKFTGNYKFTKPPESSNHIMYMDDIKLFAKSEKELETLVQAIRIYTLDIGMKFVSEKGAILIMKSKEIEITEGTELPNQDIRTLGEKENYKYLWILEADTIKQAKMKEK